MVQLPPPLPMLKVIVLNLSFLEVTPETIEKIVIQKLPGTQVDKCNPEAQQQILDETKEVFSQKNPAWPWGYFYVGRYMAQGWTVIGETPNSWDIGRQ